MSGRLDLKACVVGAGVFGLGAALQLTLRGAKVRLYDPTPGADSASAVAAGMIAPAFEAALDPATADHFPLLRRARDAWPALIEGAGLAPGLLDRSGALYLDDDPERLEAVGGRLRAAGASHELIGVRRAEALAPGLAVQGRTVIFSGEDWRLDPVSALAELQRAFLAAGGELVRDVVEVKDGSLVAAAGPLECDVAVLATGAEAAGLAAIAPELDVLAPIKGQILRFAGGPDRGPVVRTPQGYVSPQPGGALAGATMEPGRSDRDLDPEALERLRRAAASAFPALAGTPATGRAGVRAATPDGLPLVGPSAASGRVFLATGARRNGWLLAPLVGALAAELVCGGDGGELGRILSPRRFA